MSNKEQIQKNLERLISAELRRFTRETGEVVDELYVFPQEDKDDGDTYYDIFVEFLEKDESNASKSGAEG
ncbi:hypothetical protein D9Y31_00605 [Acinetobacter baumannii]|uniref:hypothetical protein n=1 Tax=Acinetobacter baumannii TaxID=470 RepID=UPI0010CC0181|nr:hypothetical protein [Acinetobacter baumannii]TKV65915.1 hypothetical protein D9Y31_00605 [Acinetobacter baumannii]TKV70111.1 hypothetical protein D9Y30_01880 [Acinetobacter baumannii]HEO1829157.1 hypothetical protein [Acinetobacter baumannii]